MERDSRASGDEMLPWSDVMVAGPGSASFLQGQLSQELADVANGGTWALLLAPDSVVLTSCFVTGGDDVFILTVPRTLAETAERRLRRFLLRTRCTIEVAEARSGPFETLADSVEAGWPGAPEFARSLTPHAFGRAFVDATVSFTKGCFTGQELVGRLDARGSSVPWRMVRASGPSVARVDEVLRSKGPTGPQGLTSVLQGEVVHGLGFAHRTLLGADVLEAWPDVHVEAIA